MSVNSTKPDESENYPSEELENIDTVGNEAADIARRRVLVGAATTMGVVGVAVAAVPFVVSMLPSERARAAGAPIEADISKLAPGELMTMEWRGKPVWILRRTDAMLQLLGKGSQQLSDPKSAVLQQPTYCKNATRSIKPEYLVSIGLCTHLGCVPIFRPEVSSVDLGTEWLGGFYCPCHGSKFDLAGKVYKGGPAPTNLVIPRHSYLNDSQLIIGTDDV